MSKSTATKKFPLNTNLSILDLLLWIKIKDIKIESFSLLIKGSLLQFYPRKVDMFGGYGMNWPSAWFEKIILSFPMIFQNGTEYKMMHHVK